jgi:hypothetical protein
MPVDQLIKSRLGIRYADAKRLEQEARESLGDGATPEELLEEAVELFEDLDESEKEILLAPENAESDWKRKAREQAERREREWEQQAERDWLATEVVARGESFSEEAAPGPFETISHKIMKKTTTTRVVIHPGDGPSPRPKVTATAACCAIQ